MNKISFCPANLQAVLSEARHFGVPSYALVLISLLERSDPREVGKLTWSEIDFEKGTAELTHAKGFKNNPEKPTKLHQRTVRLLRKQEDLTFGIYGSTGPFAYLRPSPLMKALLAKAGLERNWERFINEVMSDHMSLSKWQNTVLNAENAASQEQADDHEEADAA